MNINQTIAVKSRPLPGGWVVVGLLCIVGFLNYLDRIMITTMRESIVDAMPMTDAQFGLLTSVFLWVYGLLSPFAGFLADRFSRSRVIIGSLFLWSVITWLTAHATSFNQLLATRALMGVSEACYIPAAMALIADYHRGNTRSLAMGIHLGGVMIGQSFGFLGGWIAEKHDWSMAFSVFGLFGVVYAFVIAFFLRDTPDRAARQQASDAASGKVSFLPAIKNLFGNRSFLLLLVVWSFLGIIGWMILGWLPTYYKEHFHLDQATAGLYATGYVHPISMVGVLLGGFLADRWSRTNRRGRILLPAIGLCVAAPAVFMASSTGLVYIAIVGFMFYALTRTFSDVNMMPMLCMVSDNRFRATGYGVLNMFACLVGGAGIYAGGLLRDANFHLGGMFKIAALLMLICAVLLFTLKAKYNDE